MIDHLQMLHNPLRKAKSEARQKMRAPVERVVVHDTTERLEALELGCDDLLLAGSIEQLDTVAGLGRMAGMAVAARHDLMGNPRALVLGLELP